MASPGKMAFFILASPLALAPKQEEFSDFSDYSLRSGSGMPMEDDGPLPGLLAPPSRLIAQQARAGTPALP